MKALIDGDILVYRVGFTTGEVNEGIAAARMDESIRGILEALETTEYTVYLTEQQKNNFRYAIYPDYKNNRKAPKPLHYAFLREYLVLEHNAVVVEGQEADDQLGIDQTKDTIICSTDKDLDQIPGWHFNFVKQILYEVTPEQALKWFYTQLLTGDKAVDNIPGLAGVGPKKAEKWLKDCLTEEEMYAVIEREYKARHPDRWLDEIILNGQLLKIRTRNGEMWLPPNERNQSTVPA